MPRLAAADSVPKSVETGVSAFDDKQAEMAELIELSKSVVADLQNAECCETATDFEANISEATHTLRRLLSDVTRMSEPD